MEYKTMRDYKVSRLLQTAQYNLANSDIRILDLRENVLNGKTPTCQARKVYAALRRYFVIDLKRCTSLQAMTALTPSDCFEKALTEFDEFFGYKEGV